MFSNTSRYRAVPDEVVTDARDRTVVARGLRPLPATTGVLTHVINAGDRLDQLAFAYYGRPLHYWRICDANPGFLSPLALLGREPLVTTYFPVSEPDTGPPWARALRVLSDTVGVVDVSVIDEPVPPRRTALLVRHNRLDVDAGELAEVIGSAGFTVGTPAERGRVGATILIPPAPGPAAEGTRR
jgi:phage tail protein X